MAGRWRCWVTVVVAWVLAWAPGQQLGAQDQTTTRGWDQGQAFYTDLSAGWETRPLPFDVHFKILTPPPEGKTATAVGSVYLAKGDMGRRLCGGDVMEPLGPGPKCPEKFPQGACTLDHHDDQAWPNGNQSADKEPHLRIDMPILQVKEDYCLLVVYPASDDDREKLTTALEHELEEQKEAGSLDSRDLTSLCSSVERAFREVIRQRGLRLKESLDTESCRAAVQGWIHKELAKVSRGSLKTEVEDAVESISDLLKEQANSLSGTFLDLRNGGRTAIEKYALQISSNDYLDRGEPKTAQEALERANAVQTKVRSLSPGAPDCTKGFPEEADLESKIAGSLAGVCAELHNLRETLQDKEQETIGNVKELAGRLASAYPLSATTWAGYEGRFYWYISADQGFAYAWDLEESFLYTGANVYFRPVNKKAPLDQFTWAEQVSRRFAIVVGIPNEKLEESDVWDPIVLDRPIVLGAGWRFNDHLRFTVGGLVVDEENPNPLIDDNEGWKLTPFASLSLDIDVVGLFKNLFPSNTTNPIP